MSLSSNPVSRVVALYVDLGHSDYIGESVSQLEHAAQAADCALAEGHSDAVVCAAFLHDVGHLCDASADRMGGFGTAGHEVLGAAFLRELGFGAEVTALVEGHVAAKRYLTFKDPEYFTQLSPASKATLGYQGGPMTRDEAADFESDALFSLILELRTWDEAAKVPGRPVLLSRYEAILERGWNESHVADG